MGLGLWGAPGGRRLCLHWTGFHLIAKQNEMSWLSEQQERIYFDLLDGSQG